MREITTHMTNGCNENLQIVACDGPGPGGASHVYEIIDVSQENTGPGRDSLLCHIEFQNGPLKESGNNGVTHETLLAILMDRLSAFQDGPYACEENAVALFHCRAALASLKKRTDRRTREGKEGTLQV